MKRQQHRQTLRWGAFVVLVSLGLPLLTSGYSLQVLNLALIHAILVIGLNFVLGYAGLISLGHAAFWGIGAYISALTAVKLAFPFWLAALCAVGGTAIVSFLIGIPMLKLRGHYLALATLGFNVVVEIIARNWVPVTGGTNGVTGIPSPNFFGLSLESSLSHFYLLLITLALASLVAYKIRHSHFGRAMIAVRDEEMAAGTSGVNVTRLKTYAFVLGGLFAGLAGSLYAHTWTYIAPTEFSVVHSITFLSMLIVGGEGTIPGAILGAVLLTFLPEWFRFLGHAYLAFFGIMMLLILVFMPGGVVGVMNKIRLATPGNRGASEARATGTPSDLR